MLIQKADSSRDMGNSCLFASIHPSIHLLSSTHSLSIYPFSFIYHSFLLRFIHSVIDPSIYHLFIHCLFVFPSFTPSIFPSFQPFIFTHPSFLPKSLVSIFSTKFKRMLYLLILQSLIELLRSWDLVGMHMGGLLTSVLGPPSHTTINLILTLPT